MKQLKQLAREIIPVIIGILIALFINNWNEDRKDKKYLNKIFYSIEKELEESNADIKDVIPKQLAVVDSIDRYINNDKVSLYDIMVRAGIYSPRIKTNSWNAVANSRIDLIEYDKLSALDDIEERKENISRRIEKQMDYIFQNLEKSDRESKIVLKMMILDAVHAERGLQTTIEGILTSKDDNKNG